MSSWNDYVDQWLAWCEERGIEPAEAGEDEVADFEASLGEPDLDAIEEARMEWEREKGQAGSISPVHPTFEKILTDIQEGKYSGKKATGCED